MPVAAIVIVADRPLVSTQITAPINDYDCRQPQITASTVRIRHTPAITVHFHASQPGRRRSLASQPFRYGIRASQYQIYWPQVSTFIGRHDIYITPNRYRRAGQIRMPMSEEAVVDKYAGRLLRFTPR